MRPAKTTEQVLASLSRAHVLQCLAFVQRRRARDALLERLLEARLTAMVPSNGHGHPHRDQSEWLTIKDVARVLRLTPAYIRELLKRRELHALKVPGPKGYIRVSRDSVNALIKENGRNGGGYR